MRKSIRYLIGTALASTLLLLMIGLHPILNSGDAARRLLDERRMVQSYGLTDICLFTEAPHTRHPNMADRFVPFQNHPSARAHFPSESFILPPHHVTHDRPVRLKEASP